MSRTREYPTNAERQRAYRKRNRNGFRPSNTHNSVTFQDVFDAVSHSADESESEDWYTPQWLADAARRVLGGIDLDPASCETAQQVIQARHYYTEADNGLLLDWPGRVYLNPPYSVGVIDQFVGKAIAEYTSGRARALVLVVNSATDTKWYHRLLDYPFCLLLGRVKFWNPVKVDARGKPKNGTKQPQTVFYLGRNRRRFASVFGAYGVIR